MQLCAQEDFIESLIYTFLGIIEKRCKLQESATAGNVKIISLTFNCNAKQIM
jgi:hypothetical protein